MKSILILATALILQVSSQTLQAQVTETIETNVVCAFKLLYQLPPQTLNGKLTYAYKTVTVKTADIIRLIGEKEGKTFTSKARILTRFEYSGSTPNVKQYIRDSGPDLDVTSYFVIENNGEAATKGSIVIAHNKGTLSQYVHSKFDLIITKSGDDITKGLDLDGPFKGTVKALPSDITPGTTLTFVTISGKYSGSGYDIFGLTGYLIGTVKIAGPKHVTP